MDNLFFMTGNRFGQSWMRRMVDAVRADPEAWMMADRSIGWTDTYNQVADQIAVDAYLESSRAGIAAYVLPDPVTGAGGRVIPRDEFYADTPATMSPFERHIDAEYWAMRAGGGMSISDLMRGHYCPPSERVSMRPARIYSHATDSPGRQRLITLAVRHCWRKP